MRYYLDFEKQLEPLETKDRRNKEVPRRVRSPLCQGACSLKKAPKMEREIYGNMSNWQRSQLSRHLNRPHTLDYIRHLCTDFVELHGDRRFKDDPAIVGGPARFNGTQCCRHRPSERQRRQGYG